MNKTKKHALVIGGGIAGPLSALALQRVGIQATVYEAYAESAGLLAGSWLTVAVNGLAALRALDLHEEVKACGFASERIAFVSGTGKPLGSLPIGGTLEDGTVTHTMKRADLYACIDAAVRARGVQVEHGKRVVDVESTADGVCARFADGSEARGDFLIGADGVRSQVRACIDPGAPKPRYTGLGNLGGFVPLRDDERASLGLEPGTYVMIFGKRCFFGITVAPVDAQGIAHAWWFANPPLKDELSREELATRDWRAHLEALCSDDVGPMRSLLRATPGPLLCTNTYDLENVPHWQRGRLLLIGDAAHAAAPSSGQGASMAAEDAVALGACMRPCVDGGLDVEQGLAAFVTMRRPRAERVVAYGRRYSNTKTVGPVGRVLRDFAMPYVFRAAAKHQGPESMAWLYRFEAETAAAPLGR